MVVIRQTGKDHINQSLKQVDSSTWLIGSLVLRRSSKPSDDATWNDSGDNSSYTLTVAPTFRQLESSPPDSPFIKLVHEAGDASAVWSIDFVQAQNPSFDTPRVIYHAFGKDRSYLFLQRLPGQTLDTVWPRLNETWRQHYVNAVVNICKEMAEWERNKFGGVDSHDVPEYYLQPKGAQDFSALQATCEVIGMDCSKFVFYHADLGPANIVVEDEPKLGKIGIIDFEIAGYFPRMWIRTKFRLSSGMDLSASASNDPTWWRSQVQRALGSEGFEDCSEAWMKWRGL